jgi:hypothetical protein
MKKNTQKKTAKLKLCKETVQHLGQSTLEAIQGGFQGAAALGDTNPNQGTSCHLT